MSNEKSELVQYFIEQYENENESDCMCLHHEGPAEENFNEIKENDADGNPNTETQEEPLVQNTFPTKGKILTNISPDQTYRAPAPALTSRQTVRKSSKFHYRRQMDRENKPLFSDEIWLFSNEISERGDNDLEIRSAL